MTRPGPARLPRPLLLVVGLVALGTVACSDDPVTPVEKGTIEVRVSTVGLERDADAYNVHLDGGAPVPAGEADTVDYSVEVGSHTVSISDVEGTCAVEGDVDRDVTVASGQTMVVSYLVRCPPAAGLLALARTVDGTSVIMVMDVDGERVVVDGPGDAWNPAISPDGDRIAFESDRGGSIQVWVVDLDGTGARAVTSAAGGAGEPAWSPDGDRLAVVQREAEGGQADVWVVDSDGTDPRRLTTDPGDDVSPAWSPDGTRVGFVTERDGNAEVYTVAPDGTGETRLTDTDHIEESDPAWSPDGSQIAYSGVENDERHIHFMRSDGTNELRVPDTSGRSPVWSPDGNALLYVADRDGSAELWLTFVTGGIDYRQVTDSDGEETAVDWGS